ncbi:hypothetical protein GGR57DRAFT_348401 [Xylariaceae sp. FL1272]|nr:hypothetical protein GGR57DRAFT_348401 [Xylariaceae sp. FL1272]
MFPTGGTEVDERVKVFIATFYEISDDPEKTEEWLEYFAPDATLIMGDNISSGIEEIREFRKAMWENVRYRAHRPDTMFPFSALPEPTDENPEPECSYMIHGVLDLGLKNGDMRTAHWAARATLKDIEGDLKYTQYQVYLHILEHTYLLLHL